MTTKFLETMQQAPASVGAYDVSSRTRPKAFAKAARGVSEGTHPRSMDITPSVLAKHASRITPECPDPMNLMARQKLIGTTDYSRSIEKYKVPEDYVCARS